VVNGLLEGVDGEFVAVVAVLFGLFMRDEDDDGVRRIW